MKEIKTKPKGGRPKLLESAAKAPKTAMKDVWLKSKEKAVSECKETPFASQQGETSNAPANSAGDQMLSSMETTARKGADLTYRGGKKLAQTTVRKMREKREVSRVLQKAKGVADQARKAAQIKTKNAVVKGGVKGKPAKTVKTASRSVKDVKQSVKSVKTTHQAAKAAQQAVKAAQKTAQATAKATQKAAQATRSAAKAAATGAKVTVKATVTAVKAAIAAVKGLISVIAAGGWVAVVIILIICIVAMLLGSVFGIFFSGEYTGSSQTLKDAVLEIQADYENSIEEIKRQNDHDVVEVSGAEIDWPEVLAVYAVKTGSTQEIATMDENKKAALNAIFWDTHTITYHSETRQVTEVTASVDKDGNLIGTENTTSKKHLLISVCHKTVAEMAELYGFSDTQEQQFTALLQPENDSLWTAILSDRKTKDSFLTGREQMVYTTAGPTTSGS